MAGAAMSTEVTCAAPPTPAAIEKPPLKANKFRTVAPRASERSEQAITPQLDQLVADCLASDPEKRPANADAIIARLDALELAEPWDQQAARSWWTANAKRLGTAGHDVAVSAARSMQAAADALRQPVSE